METKVDLEVCGKYSNETLITHPDKTFDPPIPPGYEVEVTPGDGVELPPGTEIVTEPTSPNETTGESGGETIVGGAHSHRPTSWNIYNSFPT